MDQAGNNKTHQEEIKVNENEWLALDLAQSAINYTRGKLRYGSENIFADMLETRDGGKAQGAAWSLHQALRENYKYLSGRKLGNIEQKRYEQGVRAGLALYHGTGNCEEHAATTFCYLCRHAPPGLLIKRVKAHPQIMDHAYTMIFWKEKGQNGKERFCQNPIVCDAWPKNAQACRWSEFFLNTEIYKNRTGRAWWPKKLSIFDKLTMSKESIENFGKDYIVETALDTTQERDRDIISEAFRHHVPAEDISMYHKPGMLNDRERKAPLQSLPEILQDDAIQQAIPSRKSSSSYPFEQWKIFRSKLTREIKRTHICVLASDLTVPAAIARPQKALIASPSRGDLANVRLQRGKPTSSRSEFTR